MIQAHHLLNLFSTYLLFLAALIMAKGKNGIRLFSYDGPVGNLPLLIGVHVFGFLLFAVVPYFGFHQSLGEMALGAAVDPVQISVIGTLAVTATVVAPWIADKEYCRIISVKTPRTTGSSQHFVVIYFFVRILFLIVYETWFRGYLLNYVISWGVPLAIIVNIAGYALLHIVNGRNEMLVCLPFGLLLCALSVWVGAAWPAVIIHVAFTLSYEVHLVKKIIKSSTLFV